jgi:hypothetical protein
MVGPARSKFGIYRYDSLVKTFSIFVSFNLRRKTRFFRCFILIFKVDPTVSNEFATGAFRFGHTLVNSFVRRANNQHKIIEEISLSRVIFRPIEAYNHRMGGIDTLILGYLLTPSSKFDSMLNNILRNHLFQAEKADPLGRLNK